MSTLRVDARFIEREQLWAGRLCTRHIRGRNDNYNCGSRRKAFADWSFTRRHTCGDIRRFFARKHSGLVLLGAPLSFEPSENQFRDALVSLVPSEISDSDPFPGSLLSHASALASPGAFVWSRLMDAAMSIADPHAMETHARVERWALDEVPLPGKLVHQIIEWLYRENRFCRGTLK